MANKCFCDVCKRPIYKEAEASAKARPIKYWSATIGEYIDNRKSPKDIYDLCSIECCLEFVEDKKDIIFNPFKEGYVEINPVKVFGETEV